MCLLKVGSWSLVFNLNLKRSVGIPIGGLTPSKKRPIATLLLIAANVAVYAITSYEGFFFETSDCWVSAGGFVPSFIGMPTQWYRIFASMFLHADFFHILFNMYFLYLFGRAVEDALGRGHFLALYFVSGIAASIFHTAFSFLGGAAAYVIPAIGASGAISGVLGAYLILFPGTSLVMGWAFMFFPVLFKMKAAYYLIFWFATQVIYGYARLGGSTAVFAHAGGFIAGMALLPLVANKERFTQFKLAGQTTFLTYRLFTPAPAKTGGLSHTTKIIIAIILATLLFGTVYASSGLSIQGDIKSATIQYSLEGTPYIDYVGVKLPNIEDQLASISQDTTRILLNRLYAAGLLYDRNKAGRNISINNRKIEIQIRIGGQVLPLNLNVVRFTGHYDNEGFLGYGDGELETQIILVDSYGRVSLTPNMVDYNFELASQTVDLTYITQCTGVISFVTTAAALGVAVKKDKELTLIGEESKRL
jgi:membrane associated rhomboid family serine protease